jgi:competence protein ComEA
MLVTAGCVAIVVAGGYWLARAPVAATESALPRAAAGGTTPPAPTLPPPIDVAAVSPDAIAPAPRLVVHVAGAVLNPGVYQLDSGARVHDAVEAAGGPAATADLDGVNLAVVLADGQRIYLPEVGEVDPAAVASGAPAVGSPSGAGSPIDLNVATVDELDTLPGVGPATAAAIVDDRQRNGPFASVDDLERVPGIGPSKLASLRDLVTV